MIIIKGLDGELDSCKRLIYKLANSLSYSNREDLFQVGVIGLIEAYNHYKTDYDTKFSTYAYPYILGEMKKYLRENCGFKVSKELVYLSNRLDRLTELLTQKYKRIPTIEELSKETGIDKEKILLALNIRNSIKSIDEDITIMDLAKSYDKDNTDINEAMSLLNDDERNFIENRYFYDKTQDEMCSITGYSQAKVSRYENKILTKLRNYYKD